MKVFTSFLKLVIPLEIMYKLLKTLTKNKSQT